MQPKLLIQSGVHVKGAATISIEQCDDMTPNERDRKSKRQARKYDPELLLNFNDFCRLLEFDLKQLITEETPLSRQDAVPGLKPKKRSNSLSLPSYVVNEADDQSPLITQNPQRRDSMQQKVKPPPVETSQEKQVTDKSPLRRTKTGL